MCDWINQDTQTFDSATANGIDRVVPILASLLFAFGPGRLPKFLVAFALVSVLLACSFHMYLANKAVPTSSKMFTPDWFR